MNGRTLSFTLIAAAALAAVVAPAAGALEGAEGAESDSFETGSGTLEITFLGHASLAFAYGGKHILVDPVGSYADYGKMGKADLILVTHEHGDHMDLKAIEALTGPGTTLIAPEAARSKLNKGVALAHGASVAAAGITATATAAYNVTPGRDRYHPKSREDNGYVLAFGSFRVYVAGDTEPMPEMAELGGIDVAFLPMNQPYTMTPAQVADAARTIKPKILYPYHFSGTKPALLAPLLAAEKDIEIRVRRLE